MTALLNFIRLHRPTDEINNWEREEIESRSRDRFATDTLGAFPKTRKYEPDKENSNMVKLREEIAEQMWKDYSNNYKPKKTNRYAKLSSQFFQLPL